MNIASGQYLSYRHSRFVLPSYLTNYSYISYKEGGGRHVRIKCNLHHISQYWGGRTEEIGGRDEGEGGGGGRRGREEGEG